MKRSYKLNVKRTFKKIPKQQIHHKLNHQTNLKMTSEIFMRLELRQLSPTCYNFISKACI